MIMITSKGQLPGDFLVGFITKKSQAKQRRWFFNEKFLPPKRLPGGNVQLIDDPNRWAWWDGMGWGFLGTKKIFG